MEMVYYTIAAVILYLVSDYILNTIEIKMGKRLPQRSFFFLIIITVLTLVTFSFIRAIYAPLPNVQQPSTNQVENKPAFTQQAPAGKEVKK